MDKFDDLSAVDLDDDGDVNCSVSSDESDSVDHNDFCDQNECASMDVGDGNFKRITDLTTDEIRGLEFGNEEEAYDFYQKYAKCHGFVIRKDDMARDVRRKVIMRQFVCNRQGLRNKKHFTRVDRKRDRRPITRSNCEARLCVHYKPKISRWIITCFEEAHNHELTPSRYVHIFPAYRGMTNADKAQALFLEDMLTDKSFYDQPLQYKHVISEFALVEPIGLHRQRFGSNDCGVWVDHWMIECAWRDDYDKVFVRPATRMRIALDLVRHPYNELKDKVVERAIQY